MKVKEKQWRLPCGAGLYQNNEGHLFATCDHRPDYSLCPKCRKYVDDNNLLKKEPINA